LKCWLLHYSKQCISCFFHWQHQQPYHHPHKECTCNWSASFQNLVFRCKDLKRSIMLCMPSSSWTSFSCDNIVVSITSTSQQPPCLIGPLCSPLLYYDIGVIGELLSFSTSLKSLHKHFNENVNKHVIKKSSFQYQPLVLTHVW
jgi:hypothetical protein